MTVEQWLRGHFGGVGKLIDKDTLLLAAISPAEVEPEPLRAVSLTDEYEDYLDDAEYKKGALYALSTLYYAMSGYADGGPRSEKRGNRQITIGGKAIDVKTREDWRRLGDEIRRKKLKMDVEEEVTEKGGMFDATPRTRGPRCITKYGAPVQEDGFDLNEVLEMLNDIRPRKL